MFCSRSVGVDRSDLRSDDWTMSSGAVRMARVGGGEGQRGPGEKRYVLTGRMGTLNTADERQKMWGIDLFCPILFCL